MASPAILDLHAPSYEAKCQPMTRYWRENQWHDADFLPMSPTDRGLTHGLGLFETILAIDGSPALLERHIARMLNSCERLGWGNPLPSNLRSAIVDQLAAAKLNQGRARVRLAISAGSGPLNNISLGADHSIWITVSRAEDPPASVTLGKAQNQQDPDSPLAGIKSASYAENLLHLNDARERGFDDVIRLFRGIRICETSTSNIFAIKDGRVHYPPNESGCLPGITRSLIIELAKKNRIPTSNTLLTESDIQNCDEVFITSAIRGVVTVSRYESTEYTQSSLTAKIRQLWQDAVEADAASHKA
jgi:branched-subunit amino acid aminotransferase/4-amino-4-deoxychorismate lyase